MNTRLEAEDMVPQEIVAIDINVLTGVEALLVFTGVKALQLVRSTDRGLSFGHGTQLDRKSLKLLPKAFDLNTTMQVLKFNGVKLDHSAFPKVARAGIRRDNIKLISFHGYKEVIKPKSMETICQGFQERSAVFQLELIGCSAEFVKPIIEASYNKWFSLNIEWMDCSELQCLFKKVFFRGNLFYMSLHGVTGLKEDFFLQLARAISMIPRLGKLDLRTTAVPPSALKRLYGSMKMILGAERSNIFPTFDSGNTEMEDKLAFAYSRILSSDLVGSFGFKVKEDVSKAVVKSIFSTVAKTKNLNRLYTGNKFSSGTKFNNFRLQKESFYFGSPFGINQL